jgi:hypothetical protein
MKNIIQPLIRILIICLFGIGTAVAYEQENWYLHGPLNSNLTGVFHQEYDEVNKRDMLYRNVTGVGLEVRDINGTLLQTIDTGGTTFTDIEYDQNTSRLFGIYGSRLACFEQNASGQWEQSWKYNSHTITSFAQGPNGKLYGARNTKWLYIFEQNGTKSSSFTWVDGINSLGNYANIIGFASGGTLVVRGQHSNPSTQNYRTFYFKENGQHIRNWHHTSYDSSTYLTHARISSSGIIAIRADYAGYGSFFFHPNADASIDPADRRLSDPSIQVDLWLQNGDFISGSNLYRRTFRTKMETKQNSVPEPVIHRIAQRAGTNILELDFEVIDTDDDNVTVGILAYCGSDKLVPQSWLNGTGSKIGTPIATNTVHSMLWDVKQDWTNSTGSIKFEILCQDGSRNKPVDLHFLNLPFDDGNLTISRSPLKDSDFKNYAKYLLAKGAAQFESSTSFAVSYLGSRILNNSWAVTTGGRTVLLNSLGSGYRWATSAEVTKAREAASPGGVNNWGATNRVKPRNLPGSVNEYGFDVSTTSGFWVVKE